MLIKLVIDVGSLCPEALQSYPSGVEGGVHQCQLHNLLEENIELKTSLLVTTSVSGGSDLMWGPEEEKH